VKKITKNYYYFLFLISLLVSRELIFLFYDSTDSPDFSKYIVYFDYFFGNIENTSREQGLLYYYLHAWGANLNTDNFTTDLPSLFLHKSVQQINYYIYIYGLLGYYLLLKEFNISKKNIFLSLTFLNFFPLTIALRMAFKPEILAFALIPWIIFLLEKFKNTKNYYYLFFSIPYFVFIFSTKGSVSIIAGVFLTLTYLNTIIKGKRKFIFINLLILIFIFCCIQYEDTNSNGKSLFDISSGSGEEISTESLSYDYKAPVSFIYKVNMYELFTSPIKNNHKDSFISITLLDTFGDYFDLFWNNNSSAFSKGRSEIITLEQSNLIKMPKFNSENNSLTVFVQNKSDLYLQSYIGLIISIIFYLFLYRSILLDKKFRKFYIAPLYGMSILLIHVITGLPKNNFDPSKGDSLKPFYYSFLICLSFIFLISRILEKRTMLSLLIFPYIIVILFLLGFPKNIEPEREGILLKSKESVFCEVNKQFLFNEEFKYSCTKDLDKYTPIEDSQYKSYTNKPKNKVVNISVMVFLFASNMFILYKENYLKRDFLSLPSKARENK